MAKSTKPRKKMYLINRDFQLRYSFAACIVGVVSTCSTAIVLLYPLYVFEILRIPRFLPLPILIGMGSAVLINVFLVGLLGVFITHKIAGPMYSLVRSFRRVEMGRWAGHLKIRDGDDLRYVVRNFNQMVDGLVMTGRQELSLIDELIEDLNQSNGSSHSLETLKSIKSRWQERLSDTGDVEGEVLTDSRDE